MGGRKREEGLASGSRNASPLVHNLTNVEVDKLPLLLNYPWKDRGHGRPTDCQAIWILANHEGQLQLLLGYEGPFVLPYTLHLEKGVPAVERKLEKPRSMAQ